MGVSFDNPFGGISRLSPFGWHDMLKTGRLLRLREGLCSAPECGTRSDAARAVSDRLAGACLSNTARNGRLYDAFLRGRPEKWLVQDPLLFFLRMSSPVFVFVLFWPTLFSITLANSTFFAVVLIPAKYSHPM